MAKLKINREKYTDAQLILLVLSIIVYVFINRHDLTEFEGWLHFMIYIGFNWGIMVTGQKLGSYKETLKRLYGIIDGDAAVDIRLNEALHELRLAGDTAGIVFQQYNKSLPRRIRKQQEKAEKAKLTNK